MTQAVGLAKEAVGLASPNPTVGCVILRDGIVVGHGAHEYDRRDHAEIVALREAGDLARGATAYVSLEPCSHHGRTGPCADALIAAGVARVVVATEDANPAVHGRGIAKLRHAGIEVVTEVLQQPAQRLNAAFAKYIRTGLPYVTLKAAMSLDGRIAPPPSGRMPKQVAWITGAESRQHVQLLRHSVDAIVTGIGTVLADDPLLTDRSKLPRRRPLLRVVLDSKLRLPPDSKLVQSAKEDLLVFCADPSEQRLQALSEAGVVVRQIPREPGSSHPSLRQMLKHLGEMKITSVMVEAGSELNAGFVNADLVDRLYLFYAPIFLGPEAQPVFGQALKEKLAIQHFTLNRYGNDVAIEAHLNNPWQS